jgi:hypothetical protein
MTLRVLHIYDPSACEDDARLLALLAKRFPRGRIEQSLVCMGQLPDGCLLPDNVKVVDIPRRLEWSGSVVPALQKRIVRSEPSVILAWGVKAAVAARLACEDELPVVLTLADPAMADALSKWWRSAGGGASKIEIICSAQHVQRRVVEAGVPIEVTAVIRPGVDFAAIREARQRISRSDLGLPQQGRVFLTASPPTRPGGQYLAMWALAILHHIWPNASLVFPGVSKEQRRMVRLAEQIYCPQVYFPVGDRFAPAELLAVADALVVPATADIPTGWLAWAMAAGVPIIGSAVPAVAEMIADRHNGFLCKPGEPHTLAIRMRTAMESDPAKLQECVRTAQQQAFEIFRAERCIDEYLKVIDNAVQGRSAVENIQDAAVDA